ncbi:MAG TPA: alginate lyase family protein [Candidatus Acidoferrales bacterium]|nr:alginate lyase family protein [Candidatus Acidoferrales bacterium]
MSELLSYLAAQARTQPGSTLRFVAGELWRRGRARLHPALATGVAELGPQDFRRAAPLFLPSVDFAQHAADRAPWVVATLERAKRISAGEVEVFGEWTALGTQPDWQHDWKSGHRWPLAAAGRLRVLDAPPGADVKRPWEVARFHHGLALGGAAALTGDAGPAQAFAAMAQHWIEHNPWPRGIHWSMPMEVALRAINWIQAAMLVSAAGHLEPLFARELSRSLFLHGRHLWAYREWNPVARANHYLACVVGLVWLGVLFEGTAEGRQWLEFGRSELMNEMECQTGADGVAREGSSGYHALVAELFLSAALLLARREGHGHATNGHLAAAIARATSAEFSARLVRLFDFLAALCAGREEPPNWGDADDGRALPFGGTSAPPVRVLAAVGSVLAGRTGRALRPAVDAEIFWRFGALPSGPQLAETASCWPAVHHSQAFAESGFFFFSSRRLRGSLRCGPLGVRGWANHAHNDQLSFEFALDGRPVIVDPGLPCYADDPVARNLFRSTRYHNTVEVAGMEQNRFWPALLFRIVDDTRSRVERWKADDAGVSFAGSHSGYLRLPERALVGRELNVTPGDILTVRDTVELAGNAALAWYFHVAPGIVPEVATDEAVGPGTPPAGMAIHSRWRLGPVLLSVWTGFAPGELTARTGQGWVAPRFGHKVPAAILEFQGRLAGRAEVLFVFTPAEPQGVVAAGAAPGGKDR